MGAMLRTYQITMGRAYYKYTLRFSSTSNVTDTVDLGMGARQLRADVDAYKLNTRDVLTWRGEI